MRLSSLLLSVVLAVPAPALAIADQPLRVTTDSPEYCGFLAARLSTQTGAAQTGADQRVRALAEEGLRLCDNGHIRTGIAKLRRALRAAHASGGG